MTTARAFIKRMIALELLISIATTISAQDNASLLISPETFIIPANKAYVEPFSPGRPGVSVPVGNVKTRGVVSNWRDKTKSVVWYLYQTAGIYAFAINTTVEENKTLPFEVRIDPTYTTPGFTSFTKTITFKGTGKPDSLKVTTITIPQTGYFRYELKPVSDPQSAITIQSLSFRSLKPGGHVNQTEYQSSPSVHLNFSTTDSTSKTYNWLYEEILVPEGGDALATYYESIGFFRGYMGIQTNSETERRVLFSVWDSKDAEKDKTITEQDYVSLVDKDDATTVNSFGGEGTGGQSYAKDANWKTGLPVKFLMNVLRQDNNSIVLSAWYKLDGEEWKYIATWRAPKEQKLFNGFYSFIENYGYTNGQLRREAYYYNAWGKDAGTGQWVHFNKVRFSNTDGRPGERNDFEQGVSPAYPDRFYMSSGGYTPTIKTANQVALLKNKFTIDLIPFEQRIMQALQNERVNKDKMKR